MEFTEQDTRAMMQDLLLTAIHSFEFPRKNLDYVLEFDPMEYWDVEPEDEDYDPDAEWLQPLDDVPYAAFKDWLTPEEINILATYMVEEWIGQQLASIENTRMKYSGADFKFTSQANHMQKLLALKKDYERKGFHLQRLYKRRRRDTEGIYHSTMYKIMQRVTPWDAITDESYQPGDPGDCGIRWEDMP